MTIDFHQSVLSVTSFDSPSIAQSVRTDLYEPIKSDPRWQAFLERYGASDEDVSGIRFNPRLPAAVEEVLSADV